MAEDAYASPFFQRERLALPPGVPRLGAEGALVELAGRDSVAAAAALAREGRLRRILPVIAYTGTEFGEMSSLARAEERLRRALAPFGVEVLEAAAVGSPLWWRAVVGRPNTVLARRYGPWHICVGCHMYLHACRVPAAWSTGAARLVAGERLRHGGRVKVNQTGEAVEAYRRVLGKCGLELELPLLRLDDEEAIVSLAGDWREGEGQPECVMAGNYRRMDGSVDLDPAALRAYLEEYLVPVTLRILDELKDGGTADYEGAVREVLCG